MALAPPLPPPAAEVVGLDRIRFALGELLGVRVTAFAVGLFATLRSDPLPVRQVRRFVRLEGGSRMAADRAALEAWALRAKERAGLLELAGKRGARQDAHLVVRMLREVNDMP